MDQEFVIAFVVACFQYQLLEQLPEREGRGLQACYWAERRHELLQRGYYLRQMPKDIKTASERNLDAYQNLIVVVNSMISDLKRTNVRSELIWYRLEETGFSEADYERWPEACDAALNYTHGLLKEIRQRHSALYHQRIERESQAEMKRTLSAMKRENRGLL